eukprot:NODE_7509_length_770_cov_25.156105_g6898_i0.p1 GENE.NODE_7509_length_770_cov_25.156105_g6898_i0~~NODE_7509_length_770_cov_25.156105_g6898_i0.p1  ORF type:complete len:256 (-),score=36.25 NODE_7509_length_770_cov_25.156105_g6898_i0:3-710(-)
MSRPIVILLFGAPGSGKGTYASALRNQLQFIHIAMGDLIRSHDSLKTLSREGHLVDDRIVNNIITKELSRYLNTNERIVLDGYPRTLDQVSFLEELLLDRTAFHHKKKKSLVDLTIELKIRDDLLLRKIAGRRVCSSCGFNYNVVDINEPDNCVYMPAILPKIEGICDKCGGSLYIRDDDKKEVTLKRIQSYKRTFEPILDHYKNSGRYCQVDAAGSSQVCSNRVIGKVKEYCQI